VVTFQITTPFEKDKLINNFTGVTVPGFVPFINGLSAEMLSPTANAYLKYNILKRKIELNQPPDFYQDYIKPWRWEFKLPAVLVQPIPE